MAKILRGSLCGNVETCPGRRACKHCHNAYNRIYRQSPDERRRENARSKAGYAERTGKLKRQPCEIQDCTTRAEKHHEDYGAPLDVRWLCRKHHAATHSAELDQMIVVLFHEETLQEVA